MMMMLMSQDAFMSTVQTVCAQAGCHADSLESGGYGSLTMPIYLTSTFERPKVCVCVCVYVCVYVCVCVWCVVCVHPLLEPRPSAAPPSPLPSCSRGAPGACTYTHTHIHTHTHIYTERRLQ